jgi:hypothetical protein
MIRPFAIVIERFVRLFVNAFLIRMSSNGALFTPRSTLDT